MLQVASNTVVERFVGMLMSRISHHMKTVEDVAPALVGFVTIYGENFEFYRDGTANVSAFYSKNTKRRYVLARSTDRKKVELRAHSQVGTTVAEFDNSTNNATIHQIFKGL
jgi:hypothetical protein